MQSKYKSIGDVRGMGLMAGDRNGEGADEGRRRARGRGLFERTKAAGLLIGKGGLFGVVRISPPLNITKADIDVACDTMDKCLGEMKA